MANMGKIFLAGFCWLTILLVSGCSSSQVVEEREVQSNPEIKNGELNLNKILEHPQLYVDKDVMFQGVIESVEIRKVNKDLTLLTLKMTPVENGELLKNAPLSDKFLFIEKLRQFEDLVAAVRYKNMRVRRHIGEKMKKLGIELKIEANKLSALAYFYEGVGKGGVAGAMHQVSKGYQKLGEAFFSFEKAAYESSPGTEARLEDKEKEELEKFENSLRKGGDLLLDFSKSLADAKELILDGHFSFDSGRALNRQRSSEILTYSSLLNAEAWEKEKESLEEGKKISSALAVAVKELGEGDKLVNQGMTELSQVLNKTAIQLKKDSVPTIKCAYYGYNGSHLKRCAKALKQIGHFPVGLHGQLLQSDLREEVNIMWVKANQLNIDGMIYELDYGDESGTMKKAVEFYEWAESVEKGE